MIPLLLLLMLCKIRYTIKLEKGKPFFVYATYLWGIFRLKMLNSDIEIYALWKKIAIGEKKSAKNAQKTEETSDETLPKGQKKRVIKLSRMQKIKSKIQGVLSYDISGIPSATKRFLRSIFRIIKPKRLRLRLAAGLENPAQTGYLLAGMSLLYPFLKSLGKKSQVSLEGNFDEAIFEYETFAQGGFSPMPILWHSIKFLLSKPIKNIWKGR